MTMGLKSGCTRHYARLDRSSPSFRNRSEDKCRYVLAGGTQLSVMVGRDNVLVWDQIQYHRTDQTPYIFLRPHKMPSKFTRTVQLAIRYSGPWIHIPYENFISNCFLSMNRLLLMRSFLYFLIARFDYFNCAKKFSTMDSTESSRSLCNCRMLQQFTLCSLILLNDMNVIRSTSSSRLDVVYESWICFLEDVLVIASRHEYFAGGAQQF